MSNSPQSLAELNEKDKALNDVSVILKDTLVQLSQIENIEEIILFGSRARGNNEPRSDIDLAIKCSLLSDKVWNREVVEIIENANTLLKIDCLRFEKTSLEMQQNILKYGKTLWRK